MIDKERLYKQLGKPFKTFCIIGDPINHSLSPLIHNTAFAHLNLNYSKLFLEGLSRDKKFEYFVKFVVILNQDLTKVKKALLDIDAKDATSEANFLLAINAIEFNQKEKALKFLNNSLKKSFL